MDNYGMYIYIYVYVYVWLAASTPLKILVSCFTECVVRNASVPWVSRCPVIGRVVENPGSYSLMSSVSSNSATR